jgi:hypothetical protein
VATNTGGIHVLRYGIMREQVLGLEAVLADGTVVSSMNKMLKKCWIRFKATIYWDRRHAWHCDSRNTAIARSKTELQ